MKLVSWNVNGIRAAVKKGFMQWLHEVSPDVVCLQETKAMVGQLGKETASPEGYHATWNSAERKGYSGVAIFSKKKPKAVHLGMGIERFDVEGRYIRLEFPGFDLLNIYLYSALLPPKHKYTRIHFFMGFFCR